ncbi:MAG: hypothetical protein JO247_18345, partial [Chloroflexi bacterium]|nr:hypothetical protein [Chloroflexota bacterium]
MSRATRLLLSPVAAAATLLAGPTSGLDAAASTAPPAAPTGFTAVRTLTGAINLSWSNPANSGATGYSVYKWFVPTNATTFSWNVIKTITDPTVTTYEDINGEAFAGRPTYEVCATNSIGKACAPPAQAVAPLAPTNASASTAANGDVTLTWTDAANGAAKYIIARFNPTLNPPCSEVIAGGAAVSCNFTTAAPTNATALAAGTGGTMTYTDSSAAVETAQSGFLVGKWANYGICAVNFITTGTNQTSLNQSNCIWGIQARSPEAPVLQSAVTDVTVNTGTSGNVNLTWTNTSSFGSINVYRFDQANKVWPTAARNANPLTSGTTTFADTSVPVGFQGYKVCAVNARGQRCSNFMGAAGPANPPNNAAVTTNADGSMNVTWADSNGGAADYVVGRWDPTIQNADILPFTGTPKPFTFSNISTVTGAILPPSTISFQDNSAGFGGAGGAGGIDTQAGTIDHRICAYNARGIQCAYGVPAKPPA